MKKRLFFLIMLMPVFSAFGQTRTLFLADRKKMDIEKITNEFDIQNYFDDKHLSKKGEYPVSRNTQLLVKKDEEKNSINYRLTLWSPKDTVANFGTIRFDYIEGLTNRENDFFGLVFKSALEVNESTFKANVDDIQKKLGNPNFQYRASYRDAAGTKLYCWKIKNLIYAVYRDGENYLRFHVINFEKYKEIEQTELGWRLIDL